jgi:hypothetical protein
MKMKSRTEGRRKRRAGDLCSAEGIKGRTSSVFGARLPKLAEWCSVATRAAAVAQFGKFELSGYFAWLAWLFVHILFLIGFRNRLLVMIQWVWSYLTHERGARLITGSDDLPGWPQSDPKSAQDATNETAIPVGQPRA